MEGIVLDKLKRMRYYDWNLADLPDGKSGNWKVKTEIVTKEGADIANLRAMMHGGRGYVEAGQVIKMLMQGGSIVMSNTRDEVRDHRVFIQIAKGRVLINGLGLGVALCEILKKECVEDVTVVEDSQDVIDLVAPFYLKDERVKIIHASAFDYKPEKGVRFDTVWHDIWTDICSGNLEEMSSLRRKYGRRTDWQGCWSEIQCKNLRRGFGFR